ncbi:hypothetical protein AQJ91_34165 [Streptomyces dysideae]|uniref:Uncharacterized protein n=1 Tax=Streptomyces dysideae TaxID=909626 RepID=A0A101UTY0_9ACTN|nr:hypothetical protein AQJ91_34165 [Streptomyces dysideae]
MGDDALLHHRPSPQGEPSWIASSAGAATCCAEAQASSAPSALDLAAYDKSRDGRSSRGQGAVLSWPLDRAPSVVVRAARP